MHSPTRQTRDSKEKPENETWSFRQGLHSTESRDGSLVGHTESRDGSLVGHTESRDGSLVGHREPGWLVGRAQRAGIAR